MSQVLVDTDLDALAAEYVLGTLGADERTHAQALLVMDDGFAAKVRMWERRFGELHLMVEPVDPDVQIWARIKAKVPATAQVPVTATADPAAAAKEETTAPAGGTPALPAEKPAQSADTPAAAAVIAAAEAIVAAAPAEAPAPAAAAPADSTLPAAPTLPETAAEAVPGTPPAPAPATPPVPVTLVPAAKPAPVTAAAAPFPSAPRAPLVVDDERTAAAHRRAGRWRAFAMLMTLIVVATGGLVAAWRFAPEHVPPMLQPVEALRAVGIAIETGPPPPPPRPPAPPESRYDE